MKSLLQNSAFKFITQQPETLYTNRKLPPLFAIRIQKIHTKINLENKKVPLDFSYSRPEIKEPDLGLPGTKINLSLTDLPKDKTPTMANQKIFKEVVKNKYKGWQHIYANGSKSELRVGAGATSGNLTESAI